MLNKKLNVANLRQAFAANGAVTIPNGLLPEVAEALLAEVSALNWELEIKDYSQRSSIRRPIKDGMSLTELSALIDAENSPIDGNQLFFVRYCVDGDKFNTPQLVDFTQYINSKKFLDLAIDITGNRQLGHAWIEATCYGKYCFLGGHRDDHHPDNAIAFVLNLTKVWQLDWGGLLMLQYPNNHNAIVPPIWNSLSLFRVPVDHFVSCISPAATENRYSLTGWLRRGSGPAQS